MKTLSLLVVPSLISLFIMVVVDSFIGEEAEFMNAFSVLERLFDQKPSVGDSLLARQFGEGGELIAVLVANLFIGVMLTMIIRMWRRSRARIRN